MLTRSQLRTYDEWVNKTANYVLRSAIAEGGWEKVFPKTDDPFPDWASRIRNYFNVTPTKLKQLSLMEGDKAWRASGLGSFLYTNVAYIDENSRPWFQMQATATIHHFEGGDGWGRWKLAEAFVWDQAHTSVFKLTSPDGSGGSAEVCVHNFNTDVPGTKGKSTIGPIGEWIPLRNKIVINEIYRGSYNYSETGVAGARAHTYRDVDPHKEKYGYYKNPSSSSSLFTRVFTKSLV